MSKGFDVTHPLWDWNIFEKHLQYFNELLWSMEMYCPPKERKNNKIERGRRPLSIESRSAHSNFYHGPMGNLEVWLFQENKWNTE